MSLTINRVDRDALYSKLMADLTAIGDIYTALENNEPTVAKRLRRRFQAELRLLDDLGWEQTPEAEHFDLTMTARELKPIIERLFWTSVSSTSYASTLTEPEQSHTSQAIHACPEILAYLAEDKLQDRP